MATTTTFGSSATRSLTAQLRLKDGVRVTGALTGNLTLDSGSSNFQHIDPGAASRTITLPAATGANGAIFFFRNIGTVVAVDVIISDGGTVDTLRPGESATVVCDGTDWFVQSRSAPIVVSMRYSVPTDILSNGIFVADRAYNLIGILHRSTVAGTGGACTGLVKKGATTVAITAGTAMHSTAIDFAATAAATAVIAPTVLAIAAGDALGIDVTGTSTSAEGIVTLVLAPV